MFQEPGSTVKHVKWVWPDCLVGNGQPTTTDSPRGVYNVSFCRRPRCSSLDPQFFFFTVPSVVGPLSCLTRHRK